MRRNDFTIWIAVCLLTLSWCIGCAREETSQEPSDYPDALIVAEGADGVAYAMSRGTAQVRYSLQTPYPAAGFLEDLDRRLSEMGWTPLEADFMNPKVPTSHVTGWRVRTDAGTRPPAEVHSWNGEWRNPEGDFLLFALSFRQPDGEHRDLSRLRVVAVLIPREAARKAMDHVNKF